MPNVYIIKILLGHMSVRCTGTGKINVMEAQISSH
jgi:hypothetical protein